MAKHRSRFFTKALIGMGAVAVSAVTMSTPARAETIDLICSFNGFNLHVHVDTDRQSVVNTVEDRRYGPFPASISETLIRYTDRRTDWEFQYTFDRVAGTKRNKQIYRGALNADVSGQCRRATQKF